MTLTAELDLRNVMNEHTKFIVQRSFRSRVIFWAHKHSGPTAIRGH